MILLDIFVAMAPVAAYYSQLQLIKKEKSLGTFSIDVCAILLISGILRIFFWFAHGYAFNLLIQAVCVILIQLVLLKQCISLIPPEKHEPQNFWRWKTYDQYSNTYFIEVRFLLGLTAVITVTTLLSKVIWIPLYGQTLGFLSLSIEATLGFPQLISNYKTKSVQGLSMFMIFSWFAGDFFKTVYFIIQSQPFQFTLCGTIQLTVDILILLQIMNYRPDNTYKPVRPDTKDTQNDKIDN